MSAQDNKREKCQKKQFGLEDNNSRGDKFDSIYTAKNGSEIIVDCKTRRIGKGCSTKRRFTDQSISEWRKTVLIISEYDPKNPDTICGDTIVITPENLKEWLDDQQSKLNKGTNTKLGYDDLKNIKAPKAVLDKIRKEVHLNCPNIPKKVINSGTKVSSAEELKNILEEYSKNLTNGGPNGKSIKNG